MKKIAILFPGQGSQYVGMGKDWYDSDETARELFERANSVLGFNLAEVCFNGPEETLRQTKNTQPAIFLHSVLVSTLLKNLGGHVTAGHSLGEYSALVAAEAIGFEDALRLVRIRGELMQQAGEIHHGTMAAVVGLSSEDLEAVCREASGQGIVQPANYNSPGQTVISGSVAGVLKAMELAKGKGAKLVKQLVVSGAFHSPLMESAREGLRKTLDAMKFRDAAMPVYSNVTAEPVTDAFKIRDLLYQQLTSPVRWEQTIRNMVRDGVTQFYELGPGKALQGLVKRTEPSVTVSGVDKVVDARELPRPEELDMLEIGGYKVSDELFTRGMKDGQGPCECTAACCAGGVYADVRERDRIMAHQQMIRKYMDDTQPQNAGMWFEEEEHDDPDFPSGRCVGTKEFNDKCAFLDKSGRCILQVAANGEGMDKWFLKPLYCVLYPMEITDGTVCYDNLLEGEEHCCSVSEDFETPLFQVCREELTHLLGSGGYEMMGAHYRDLGNGNSSRQDGASTRQ